MPGFLSSLEKAFDLASYRSPNLLSFANSSKNLFRYDKTLMGILVRFHQDFCKYKFYTSKPLNSANTKTSSQLNVDHFIVLCHTVWGIHVS